jgi:hypothetical protein
MGEALGQGVRALFKGLGSMFRSKGNGFKPRRSGPSRSAVVKTERAKPVEPPKPPPPPEPQLFLNITAAQERIGAGQTGEFIVRVTANRSDVKLGDIRIVFKSTDGAGGVQEDEAWTDASGVARFRAYLPPSVAAHEALDDEGAKHPWLTNASSPGKKTVCQITVTALGALAVTASLAPVATVALAGGGTAALAAGATPLPMTACAAVGAGLAALSHGTCNLVLSDEPGRAVEPKPSRETPEALPPQRSADRRPGQATKESVVADARGAHDELTRMAQEAEFGAGSDRDEAMGQPADPGEDPEQRDDNPSEEAWRAAKPDRPLNKMGHAQKHLKDFRKHDPALTDNDVAKILEHARRVGQSRPGEFGSRIYEATVRIGGKDIKVIVVESSSGVIKTGYPGGL